MDGAIMHTRCDGALDDPGKFLSFSAYTRGKFDRS